MSALRNSMAFLIFLMLAVLIPAQSVRTEPAQIWDNLEPGQYAVGFKTIEQYDYSRTFQPKADYFGNPIEGERARPVQICVWYPAVPDDNLMPMVYAEYVYPYPENENFINVLSNLQNREIQALTMIIGDQAVINDAMNAQFAGLRDAQPAEGQFPLLLYIPDLTASYCDQGVLCEYLASRGFIVATTPSLGMAALNPEPTEADLENLIRDKEFALAALRDFPIWDQNKLGVFGTGIGGLGALDLQMRNSDIDAVVSLDGWYVLAEHQDFVPHSPSYNIMRASKPILQIYGRNNATDFGSVEAIRYADRYSLDMLNFRQGEFAHYYMFSAMYTGELYNAAKVYRDSYKLVCKYTAEFFDAMLNNSETALAFMKAPVADNGFDPALAEITFMPGAELPPTRAQFTTILATDRIATAVELYNKFHAQNPDLILFDENVVNAIGYRLLQQGRIDESIRIFKMNTEVYPSSCNVWDSLSDAYMTAGDNENAIKCVRKALEALPTDTVTNPGTKDIIRTGCQEKLNQLGG